MRKIAKYFLTYIGKYDNKRHLFTLQFDSNKYDLYDRLLSLSPLGFRDVHVYDSNKKFVMKFDNLNYEIMDIKGIG